MSLLDDVSIVVTPNGYKAGELYAVIPVPTEGAELVTNGDFSADASWTKGAGWTISSGKASSDGSQSGNSELKQQNGVAGVSLDLQVGKQYKMVIDITVSTGAITYIEVAGNTNSNDINATGVSTLYFSPTSTNDRITIAANSTFIGSVNSVSIKEYTAADMDVTRATAATRVDEAGLVNYAEIIGSEQVVNGNFATDSDWVKGTGWTISGGTANSNGTQSSVSPMYQDCGIVLGKVYQVIYTVTSYTAGSVRVYLGGASSGAVYRSAIGTYTQEFTALGNQFVTFEADASFIGSIDNASIKEVTRDNVPRIDYTGGGCPHILAEPQRTNLLPYSEDFTVGNWAKVRCTVTSNQAISPEGTLNAYLMTSTFNDARLEDQVGSSGAEYTQSIYVKSAQVSDVNCQIDFGGLNTVTFTANQQWQRVETTLTDTSQNPRLRIRILNSGNSIYVWGGQLEEGSYATSYIPTAGSTVTRNQDQFTRDGIGSLINDSEGVLFLEMAALSNDLTNRNITISDGSTNNLIQILFSSVSNTIRFIIRVGGVGGDNLDKSTSSYTVTDFNKVALKWKQNDAQVWINGTQLGSPDTNSDVPTGLNDLSFEYLTVGNNFFGKVKQLQVFKTALTDSELATLTT